MYSKACNTKLTSNSRSRIKDEIECYKTEPSPHVDVNPLDYDCGEQLSQHMLISYHVIRLLICGSPYIVFISTSGM